MAPRLITVAALGLLLIGCVPASKYEALKIEHQQALAALDQAQNDAAAAKAAYNALKNLYDQLASKPDSGAELARTLQAERDQLRHDIEELQRKYEAALASTNPSGTGPLPPQVANALEELARQFPDLMEFDRERGIIRLKSDVTFAKGSAELTPQARTVIGKVAQVLNMPQVANYELLVAGHTDNTPVVQASTQRLHPDNWYLSAHRAIVVGGEMMHHSIPSQRIGVLGYADQRPIVANTTTANKARNRRVEILVLPTTYRNTSVASTPTVTRTPKAPAKFIQKDAAVDTVDKREFIGK